MVMAASLSLGRLIRRLSVVMGVATATGCVACSKAEPTDAGTRSPSTEEPPASGNSASDSTAVDETASSSIAPSDTAPSNIAPSDTAPSNTAPSNTAPSNSAPCDDEGSAAESAFEPEAIVVLPVGANVTLKVVASTLGNVDGALDFYAVLQSESEYPMCSPALQLDFFDHDDQPLGTTTGTIWTGRVFRFDGSPAPVVCVAPGQVAAAVVKGFSATWSLKDVKYVEYRIHAFAIDTAKEVGGTVISELVTSKTADGVTFRGTLTNSSDTPLRDPQVTIVPLNCVGRPLGLSTAAATLEIPPNGTWPFDSSVVLEPGTRQLAFGVGSFPPAP